MRYVEKIKSGKEVNHVYRIIDTHTNECVCTVTNKYSELIQPILDALNKKQEAEYISEAQLLEKFPLMYDM